VSKNPSRIKRPDNPVETVSWPDAQEFCKKLSEKDGKTYRLPTEAEWEYACRAGSQTAFPFGDNPSDDEVGEYAWHKGNSDKEPRAVGQKKPNAWGLYDMHGNVWEWCEDRYDEKYYASSAASDPTGASSGPLRVVRGGSWGGEAWAGKSALRAAEQDPNVGYSSVGFRVVCGPTPPPQAPALAAATAQPGAPAVPPQAQKSPPARKRAPQEPHRIIYNDDGVDAQNTTPEQFLAARLKHLMDTQVDMVTFDPMDSDSIALYPSKVAELSPFPLPAAGHDPVALALKFCHEHQIEFYPSFRMNDVHHSLHKDWARTAAWTREHPQYLLGKHGDNERYSLWSPRAYWAAKDYEAPEVRERQFLIIQEFCEKYDVDGIELDWFRDPMFFRPTLDLKPVEEKHLAMMNDLVRRIRAMTERVAKKRGRPLLIACRVPLSVERSRFVGLDVPTWLKERLVDILVLGGGYACKAMAQSVREMVAFARPFKVTVYACISPSGLKTPYDTVEAWRGAAINILHEGAGVYLFNLSYGLVPPNPPDDYKRTQSFPQQVQLYKELGSVETLKGLDKTFAVDRIEEKTLLGSIRSALVLTGRLPIALKRNAWTPVVLPVGENVASHAPAGKTAYASLRLGLSEINLADKLTLRLNGQTLKAAADGASPMGANLLKNPALEEGQAVGADVPGWHSAGHDGTKSVAVRFVTCADGLKGSRAGLLESGPTYKWVYADQYVPVQVTPSHAIQFSAWLRGDKKDISMNLVMYLLVPDREGNVKDVAVAHTHFCVGTDWKPYRAILSLDEARDLPPSLDKAEVRAIVEIYQPSARVYVDNAALTTGTSSWLKLAPPADLLKAGDNLVELRLAGETPGEEVFVECLDLMVTYR